MDAIQELRQTVARLRAPDGCPWDREQTHHTLTSCLIEETAELLDTIDREDFEHMREELGDVLLQVVMHAQITEEAGRFSLDEVAAQINEKLIRRHPHVFGDIDVEGDTDKALSQWEAIKASEKANGVQPNGVFKHLPPKLPALYYAQDVFKQAHRQSIPIPGHDAAELEEEALSLDEASVGQMLFEIAAQCRLAKIDPEGALRRYTQNLVQQIEDEP